VKKPTTWGGLANLDEIEYAVLEQTGEITIVPKLANSA